MAWCGRSVDLFRKTRVDSEIILSPPWTLGQAGERGIRKGNAEQGCGLSRPTTDRRGKGRQTRAFGCSSATAQWRMDGQQRGRGEGDGMPEARCKMLGSEWASRRVGEGWCQRALNQHGLGLRGAPAQLSERDSPTEKQSCLAGCGSDQHRRMATAWVCGLPTGGRWRRRRSWDLW